jgi:large repetitive protein
VRPEVTDPDSDKLTLSILDRSTSGSASVDGTTVRYTPASGVTGVDSVVVVGSDGRAESTPVRLTVTVQPPDAPPEAATVQVATRAGRSVKITLVGSDAEGPVTFSIPALETARYRPAHGRLGRVAGNTVRYTPKRGVQGTDGFVYQVTDSAGQHATGVVIVTVQERHHRPKPCHRHHRHRRGR